MCRRALMAAPSWEPSRQHTQPGQPCCSLRCRAHPPAAPLCFSVPLERTPRNSCHFLLRFCLQNLSRAAGLLKKQIICLPRALVPGAAAVWRTRPSLGPLQLPPLPAGAGRARGGAGGCRLPPLGHGVGLCRVPAAGTAAGKPRLSGAGAARSCPPATPLAARK